MQDIQLLRKISGPKRNETSEKFIWKNQTGLSVLLGGYGELDM
jgi:hypothetical protein